MLRLGDRVAFRGSKLGEDYLALGWVIGAAAETARLQVVWDLGGCEELAQDDVVLVSEAAPQVEQMGAARARAVERAWGNPSTTEETWDRIDPEPAPVPDWQQFYGSSRRG